MQNAPRTKTYNKSVYINRILTDLTYLLGQQCYLIRLCTEKTEEETNLPISDETLALCGERSEGLVFKGLKRHMVNHPLKEWIKSAGITRRITFHTMRHSFATLLAANGVDILTISRMLTHKSVINTQIYAKVVDERAREASEVISLK